MGSFPFQIDFSKPARFEKQVFHSSPKLPVIVGKVLKKVGEQIIKGVAAFYILLSAVWAESFFYLMPAVQACFIFSYFSVAHRF